MPEGRSCPVPTLAAIHPNLPDALRARAVDPSLAPYFESLNHRSGGPLFAGFKFTAGLPDAPAEPGGEDTPASKSPAETPEPEAASDAPLFFWYFFPLPGNLVAWETTTRTGRATYFFRAGPPLEAAVARLTRGLALINFRREPIYLSQTSLDQTPRYQRYAIGARKLPDLRALRAAYLGRANHSSPENWLAQVVSLTG